MLTVVFGKSTMSKSLVQLRYNRFKEDREDVNDNAHPSRPTTSTTDENIQGMKKIIMDNRRITIS